MAKPANIALKGFLRIDWRAPELGFNNYQAALAAVEDMLEEARDIARAAVDKGQGPGPHPHRVDHGFEWDDTGKLKDAIHVDRNRLGDLRAPSGVAAGDLIVDPVDYGDGRGPVPVGFYLEMGYTPIILTSKGKIAGNFTRYPFLGPAIDEASAHFPETVRKMYRQGVDQEAAKRKKASVIVETPIDEDTNKAVSKLTVLGQRIP